MLAEVENVNDPLDKVNNNRRGLCDVFYAQDETAQRQMKGWAVKDENVCG